ncbi:MAG: DMT family transporter [Alphaproteobacteria bacterium]
MSWIYLLIAGLFETGWPIGLKLAQTETPMKYVWMMVAVAAMLFSGYFLFLAQKDIPIGTAYAVWTGIGTVGTFCIGILFFHDTADLARFLGVFFILAGVVILKFSH